MPFEFDPAKSESNLTKHGIDFIEAQELWKDQFAAIADAKSDDEPRSALIASHKSKIWVAFFTVRESNTRIISVRRARESEEIIYYEGRTS